VHHALKRLRRLTPLRCVLLAEALVALAAARLAMLLLPFRRIAAWIGVTGSETPVEEAAEQIARAREIGWAVAALGKRVPWDGRCLAQALAALGMLRRRGMEGTISFGARSGNSGSFEAHAWLRFGSLLVTGGGAIQPTFKAFTTFARRGLGAGNRVQGLGNGYPGAKS
jgi:hypothetical protein